MATVAPVAPGAPAAGEAPQGPGPAPDSTEAARSDEVIPGVLRDEPDAGLPRSTRKKAGLPPPPVEGGEEAKPPGRDAKGRFLPGGAEQAAPAEAVEATEAVEAEALPEEQPAEDEGEPVEFAGKKFKSVAAAEQEFRSLLGRVPGLNKKLSESEKTRDEAVALAWRYHDAYNGKQGQGVAAAAETGQEPAPRAAFDPSAAVKAIDWRTHESIREEHGDQVANYWLAEKLAKGLHEGFRGEIDALRSELSEDLVPMRTERQNRAELSKAGAIFEQVAGLVDESGNVAFPELGDDQAAEEIGWIYSQLPLTPEAKHTPQAVQTAILIHRGRVAHGLSGRAPVNQPLQPEPPARRPPGDALTGRAAPPPSGRAPVESRDSAMKRAIREADAVIPWLGISP